VGLTEANMRGLAHRAAAVVELNPGLWPAATSSNRWRVQRPLARMASMSRKSLGAYRLNRASILPPAASSG